MLFCVAPMERSIAMSFFFSITTMTRVEMMLNAPIKTISKSTKK